MSVVDWFTPILSPEERRQREEVRQDVREELDFHLEMMIEENKAAGMTDAEARGDAMRQFGDLSTLESRCQSVQLGGQTIHLGTRLAIQTLVFTAIIWGGFVLYRNQSRYESTMTGMEQDLTQLNERMALIVDRAPPVVIETFPVSGAIDVDPSSDEIRVTFSKSMMDSSWSWCQTDRPFPESTAPIHYLDDGKTCVMPVKLEPDTQYVVSINSPSYRNFKDSYGRSAEPFVLAFSTAAGRR